jgi:DNA-binding MarR family transcriptional regulator
MPSPRRARDQSVLEIDGLLKEIFGKYVKPSLAPPNLNMTIGQLHCLRTIGRLGEPTMSEVADAMGLHPSTVTLLVDGLVEHGLVARSADPADRRIVRVRETAKGRKNHEKNMARMKERMASLLSGLTDDDLDQIHESLTKLREAARQWCEAGGHESGCRRKRSA